MTTSESSTKWPAGDGEMRDRIRSFDWAATPIGSLDRWPERLRSVVELMLASPLVSTVVLTADRLLLYNDAAAALYGTRHPGALGRSLAEIFPDSYPAVAQLYDRVFAGESVQVFGQLLRVGTGDSEEVFDAYLTPMLGEDGAVAGVHMVGMEVGDRVRAEARLRENEERQAFLLKLSDALRPLADSLEIMGTATRLLGQWLAADRAYYVEWPPDENYGEVAGDYAVPGLPSLAGRYPIDAFRSTYHRIAQGRTWVVDDAATDRQLNDVERCYYLNSKVTAWIDIPLIKSGQVQAVLCVVKNQVRRWTKREIALTEEIAERCWAAVERARAEAALRKSEEKYRALFASIEQGFVLVKAIQDSTGKVVDYRYLEGNPAVEKMHGHSDIRGMRFSELAPGFESYWTDPADQVLRTGQQARMEDYNQATGRWYRVHYSRVGNPSNRTLGLLFEDVTERRHGEEVLRESEERQAFLLKLSDAVRPMSDAVEIQITGMRSVAEHLGVMRAGYYEIGPDENTFWLTSTWEQEAKPLPAQMALSDYVADAQSSYRAGRTLAIPDTEQEAGAEATRDAYRAIDVRAFIAVPLVKAGRLVTIVGVHSRTPRNWTAAEISLVEAVAERTWAAAERARSETALRESEQRFKEFANSSSDLLWIRNADTLAMEYVSPVFRTIYGADPESVMGDLAKWVALVVPDDREKTIANLKKIRSGLPVVHEFRVRRANDGVFRWIRNTDFPLLDAKGKVTRIAGIGSDVTDEKLSAEHQAILLAELQHRVRNIMAMMRSVTQRTETSAKDVRDYAALMGGRVMSLARTQALLTRAANSTVLLRTILQTELAAQALDTAQFSLSGPDVAISPKAAEVLSLAIHELATNALKYGALAVREGMVVVEWQVSEVGERKMIDLRWSEARPPVANWFPPTRRGFGTELVERRVPYELDGEGKVDITPHGAQVSIKLPLAPGASILETGAPLRKRVFGGSIDMSGESSLAGKRVLVLEDDYLLAWDAESALTSAGAQVVGPFPREDAAIDAIRQGDLDAAVTDINLGPGPSFETARALQAARVPFVFLTGYDDSAIPAEFSAIPRLSKPVDTRQVVRELARLLA